MSADRHHAAGEWPAGIGRVILPVTDSTNAEALRRAADVGPPCWIMAHRQTAGRGRRGRAWADPSGNFAATLAMRLSEPPGQMALRSFTAALALAEALGRLTGQNAAFSLKWPNDVLLNGGKVSGILLETGPNGFLAVGIGANLATAPPPDPESGFAPVCVEGETGRKVDPEALLDALAAAFADWETRLTTQGFGPVRAAFLARAARLGAPITARTVTRTSEGIFETIDDSGALILATATGRVAIPAADVFFP